MEHSLNLFLFVLANGTGWILEVLSLPVLYTSLISNQSKLLSMKKEN